jgi:hypothetical protein
VITFVESPQFTTQVLAILPDEQYRKFQIELAARPDEGDVIPGLSGLRKIRVAAQGKGKRGGARIIYLHLPQAGVIFLFSLYTKGNVTDLTPEQKKRLSAAVESIKQAYLKP